MKNLTRRYAVAAFAICILFVTSIKAQWSELGGADNIHTSYFNGEIRSLVTDANGILYAAGEFTNGNRKESGRRYVAKWDDTTWSELGWAQEFVFDSTINNIVADAKGTLYAGGEFKNSNRKYFVAKWDGTKWGELNSKTDTGFNGSIANIALDNKGNVYAIGKFTNSKGNKYIAKWDGSSWSQMGGDDDTLLHECMATDAKGNLFSGGLVESGVDENGRKKTNVYVAKWNGNSWNKLFKIDDGAHVYGITIDAKGNIYSAYRSKIKYITSSKYHSGGPVTFVSKWNGDSLLNLYFNDYFKFHFNNISIYADTNLYACCTSHKFFDGFIGSLAMYTEGKWQDRNPSDLHGRREYIFCATVDSMGNIYEARNYNSSWGDMNYVVKYSHQKPN